MPWQGNTLLFETSISLIKEALTVYLTAGIKGKRDKSNIPALLPKQTNRGFREAVPCVLINILGWFLLLFHHFLSSVAQKTFVAPPTHSTLRNSGVTPGLALPGDSPSPGGK